MPISNSSDSVDLSYFPGCSLATTARENNESLILLFKHLGFNLVELDDWNCCGSSSAHSVNRELAFDLAARNLALAPDDRPLLVACPSCLLRLRHAQLELKTNPAARRRFQSNWGRPFNPDLEILHFFEILDNLDLPAFSGDRPAPLQGVKFVTYYGCMLARPPAMRHERNYFGLMEKTLARLGATPVDWSYSSRCCGTFLTVAKPEVVTPMVNEIVQGAVDAVADVIVTACAMCHMNLEVRCTLKRKVPILHFSELLAVAFGVDPGNYRRWFSRHLVDPRPALRSIKLL